MRRWFQKYFGWILPLADKIDKALKVIRYIGILVTFCISIFGWKACKDRDTYNKQAIEARDSCNIKTK